MHCTLAPSEFHLWLQMVWQPYQSIRVFHSSMKDSYLCTMKRKVWVEFVTANMSSRHRKLTSAASGQSTHITLCSHLFSLSSSAVLGSDAISWAWKSSDLANKCRFWKAHLLLKTNKQKPVLQPTHGQPHDELHRDPRGRAPRRHKPTPSSSACKHTAYLSSVGKK